MLHYTAIVFAESLEQLNLKRPLTLSPFLRDWVRVMGMSNGLSTHHLQKIKIEPR